MSQVSIVGAEAPINTGRATYNAVKIKINNPQATISKDTEDSLNGEGIYNAVDIEVNNPSLKTVENATKIYDYPEYKGPVTSDFLPIHPMNIPPLPVTYNMNNFISNKTLINAEVELEKKECCDKQDLNGEISDNTNSVTVPAPNLTTTENEKANVSDVAFHGISFKSNEPIHKVEIIPPVDIKPEVDVAEVVKKLSGSDYDVQATQMSDIIGLLDIGNKALIPYVTTEIFTELINIVQKDTSKLTPPSRKQSEIREQLIINQIVKQQALSEGQDPSKIKLPFTLTDKDIAEAITLSPLEQAERNKEYSLYTMAVLTKVYADEIEKNTGNIIPLTDLPGVSAMVDAIRYNKNADIRNAAIDSLIYINRPEYSEELSSVLSLAANDKVPYVARKAESALKYINE